MPLANVHFDIAGDAQYSRAFELMGAEASDLSEPFREIGDQLILTVGEQFETEGARSGQPWHPLDPSYARWKEQHFPGRPILVRTGEMRGAALDKHAIHVSHDRLLYEIDDPKAIWHQRGSGHNPQRKLVDLGLADRREWDRIFAHWVNSLRRGPIRHSGG